jgi:hypothetical protein
MQTLKMILISFIVTIVTLAGVFLYFAARFTATGPPLKKYTYSGSIVQFENEMNNLMSNNPDISVMYSDIPGKITKTMGYPFHFTVKIRSIYKNNEYEITYGKERDWMSNKKTVIKLDGAYDRLHNTGVRKIKDKGVNEFIKLFENDFLKKLDNKQLLKQINSSWYNF